MDKGTTYLNLPLNTPDTELHCYQKDPWKPAVHQFRIYKTTSTVYEFWQSSWLYQKWCDHIADWNDSMIFICNTIFIERGVREMGDIM